MEHVIAGYLLGKSGIRINGYMKAKMDLERDTCAKAK